MILYYEFFWSSHMFHVLLIRDRCPQQRYRANCRFSSLSFICHEENAKNREELTFSLSYMFLSKKVNDTFYSLLAKYIFIQSALMIQFFSHSFFGAYTRCGLY